jgi:nucleotide-binding universal stress UspA family protein
MVRWVLPDPGAGATDRPLIIEEWGPGVPGFDCILIPLDGSTQAESALDWAPTLRARRIRLLRVCPAGEEGSADAAKAYLANAAERACPPGTLVEAHVVGGEPADRIVAEAAASDLILMSTRGAGDGGRRLFGSVADRVSRHAPVPTVLLRSGRAPVPAAPLRRIVVPLDGSVAAERALPLGTRLAALLGAPMHLVAVDESRAATRAGDGSLPPLDAETAAYLEARADAVRASGVGVTTEVRAGAPEGELLQAVAPGDLLVMTTHGRGAARRWQIGHVADRLIRHAPVPVALIRADGDE